MTEEVIRHVYVAKPDGALCGVKGIYFAWAIQYVTCPQCIQTMKEKHAV